MINILKKAYYLVFIFLLTIYSCKTKPKYNFESPAGYDFSAGEKLYLLNGLDEVSGIAFEPGGDSILMAINDEEGRIYRVNLNDPKTKYIHYKFAKSGDYEDIAFFGGKWRVLKSNGYIYSYSIEDDLKTEPSILLPEQEYEGMAYSNGKLYVIAKDGTALPDKKAPVYIIGNPGDSLVIDSTFHFDVSAMETFKKKKILVSALAQNPITKEWYILSHLNTCLFITDENFKVKQYIKLSKDPFFQPEGIAFSSNGDLYISNEGDDSAGKIMKFKWLK